MWYLPIASSDVQMFFLDGIKLAKSKIGYTKNMKLTFCQIVFEIAKYVKKQSMFTKKAQKVEKQRNRNQCFIQSSE